MLKTDLKTRGISDDLRDYVKQDPDLECVLKLDHQVQGVKGKHADNKVKNQFLNKEFKDLESKFEQIIKETGKSASYSRDGGATKE